MTDVDWNGLRAAAERARERAYAPYSRFEVGAALLAADGTVYAGANVENASYGLSQCAERSAMGMAIAGGARRFRALAIVAPGPRPASPCGMCRQVLREFETTLPVRCFTPEGGELVTDLAELLPHSFGPENLERRP